MDRYAGLRRYAVAVRRLIRARGPLATFRRLLARARTRLGWEPPAPIPARWLPYYRRAGATLSPRGPDAREGIARVSVVIICHAEPLLNQLCLRSVLSNTTYPNHEILLVVYGPAKESSGWLGATAQADAHFQILAGPESHSRAAGRNLGARAATGKYLLFLEDDVVVPPGWIELLTHQMQSDSRIGLIGPMINAAANEQRVETDYSSPTEMEALAADRAARMVGRSFDIRMVSLKAALTLKDRFLALGGVDEEFEFGVFEAEDLAMKYRGAGLRAACAQDAFVHHFGPTQFRAEEYDTYLRLFETDRLRFETKSGAAWCPHRFWQPPSGPGKPVRLESRPPADSGQDGVDPGLASGDQGVSGAFVIGCPRSGTSALAWALAEHPALWTSAERIFLWHLLRTPWLHEQYRRSTANPDAGELLTANEVSYAEFAARIGAGLDSLIRSRSHKRIWVDQTPDDTLVADRLVLFFPDARFIHIIRDGRDVVNSMLNSGFAGPEFNDFELACRTWVHYVDRGRQLMLKYPGRVLEVRNEGLVSDPSRQFERVFSFLRLPPCSESVTFIRTKRINSSYLNLKSGDMQRAKDPGSVPTRPWRTWTQAQRTVFTRIAGELMIALGYDLSFE